MLKSRLLSNLTKILPCNTEQVPAYWTAFTGCSHGPGLAWNVRINPYVKDAPEGFDAWAEDNADKLEYAFGDHCEAAYEDFQNQMQESFPNDKLEFSLEGRSGGWLCLTRWTRSYMESGNGFDKTFDFSDHESIVESVNAMTRNELIRFRQIIRAINAECTEERRAAIGEWIGDWYIELYDDDMEESVVNE